MTTGFKTADALTVHDVKTSAVLYNSPYLPGRSLLRFPLTRFRRRQELRWYSCCRAAC